MKTALLLLLILTTSVFSQQNNWQQTNGPFGGQIRAQAINSKGYIFEGIGNAGIIRSTDNGNNWESINNGLDDIGDRKAIETLVINSNDIILIKTNGGFFNSVDDGEHWIKLSNPPDWQYFQLFKHSANNYFFC